ncbi:uncharacterized protein DUF1439 [Bisgaardia hudsonensis]|uniref:Uncharacterized protein DUF1439 n=1 Tax=Bisgaardia hudsonensis TaxID=109472 RepID=A0A4V2SJ85_9PAST|nr:DUF1439 domain-containing protein [Bisgaardia hudsonensis]QLB12977.1 hypothetical protein A6A11_04810 [Bisgaardia hudsonensis]TCP13461.1 uncharacterized protein DUF1439 [Bisgaardia hudsonensis]
MFFRHLLFLILSLLSFNLFANPLSISENEINKYLSNKVSLKDTIAFPGLFAIDYQLSNLSAKLGKNNSKKIEVGGTVTGNFKLGTKDFDGKINLTFDTIPYYDPEKAAVYLKDIRILSWSGSPDKYIRELQTIMPFLSKNLSQLASYVPIYELDSSKPRDVIIKKFAKGILVEEGRLVLETNFL